MSKLIKSLNKNSKILSISDSDLDGATAQICLSNSFRNITLWKTTYSQVDDLLKQIKWEDWDAVILTDITANDRVLMDNEKLILLDHHESAIDLHDIKKNRFVIPGKCSAYWARNFCETTLSISLNHLSGLVYLVNDYDIWELKCNKSRFLNCLFYKYFSEKFQQRFFDGSTRFNKEEMAYLRKKRKDFLELYQGLDVYNLDKINGAFVQCNQFHNEISHKLMDEEGFNIIFFRNPMTKKVSVRSNSEKIHVGNALKELKIGGGHKSAGGFFEPNLEILQKKILEIENYILEKLKNS